MEIGSKRQVGGSHSARKASVTWAKSWLIHVYPRFQLRELAFGLQRYRAAFFFALGNTCGLLVCSISVLGLGSSRLVAKDLEQATRIGLQGRSRHRVVTSLGRMQAKLAGTSSKRPEMVKNWSLTLI